MVLSQEVAVSLSIIALCALVGAGVGVGSGVGERRCCCWLGGPLGRVCWQLLLAGGLGRVCWQRCGFCPAATAQ